MIRGLRPDDPPDWVRDLLIGESRDVMLVGHMPSLPAIASALAREPRTFPLHGALVFERTDDWLGLRAQLREQGDRHRHLTRWRGVTSEAAPPWLVFSVPSSCCVRPAPSAAPSGAR